MCGIEGEKGTLKNQDDMQVEKCKGMKMKAAQAAGGDA